MSSEDDSRKPIPEDLWELADLLRTVDEGELREGGRSFEQGEYSIDGPKQRLDQLEIEKSTLENKNLRRNIKLRSKHAGRIFWLLVVQLAVMNLMFGGVLIGYSFKPPTVMMNVYIAGDSWPSHGRGSCCLPLSVCSGGKLTWQRGMLAVVGLGESPLRS